MRIVSDILFALGIVTFITGCADPLECGPNTTSRGGKCVVTASTCGEGTKLVERTCVLESEPVTCADGTVERMGRCEPTESCGPETMADASGRCVPVYDKLMCGDHTIRQNGSCVSARFRIASLEHPDEIAASANRGENEKPLTVNWEGDPTFPVTVHTAILAECPSGTTCTVDTWTIEKESNPLTIEEALGCWGSAAGMTFEHGFYMTDAEDERTNLAVAKFDCVAR